MPVMVCEVYRVQVVGSGRVRFCPVRQQDHGETAVDRRAGLECRVPLHVDRVRQEGQPAADRVDVGPSSRRRIKSAWSLASTA